MGKSIKVFFLKNLKLDWTQIVHELSLDDPVQFILIRNPSWCRHRAKINIVYYGKMILNHIFTETTIKNKLEYSLNGPLANYVQILNSRWSSAMFFFFEYFLVDQQLIIITAVCVQNDEMLKYLSRNHKPALHIYCF